MKNKKFAIISIVVVVIITIIGCILWYFIKNKNITNGTGSSQGSNVQKIETSYTQKDLDTSWDNETAVSIVLGDSGITSSNTSLAVVQENVVTIKSAGEYHITGSSSNAQIVVDAGNSDDVRIILDGVSFTCSNSSPIFVKAADKVVITLQDGTVNTITGADSYELDEDDEPDGVIFSKEDLVINGTGTLNVTSNYQDAIVSKDGLKIISGIINVVAKDDGIRGKDYVVIKDGTVNIKSTGTGIKASNKDSDDVGYVVIEGGNIDIEAGVDAIHAESSIQIEDGTINIEAGDDAMHAENNLVIESGNININKSNEGLEAEYIIIEGGKIYVVASDDGINISASDTSTTNTSAQNGRGMQKMDEVLLGVLTINGGYVYVNASGDGLDSNGSIEINGGTVIVDGPTNNGNGALDYNGTLKANGGLLIAVGSSGMLQTASEGSSINCISVTFDTVKNAEEIISVVDSNGNEVVTYSPSKKYQSVVICSESFKNGETYKVYTGGTSSSKEQDGLYENGGYNKDGELLTELTVNSTVTAYGSKGMENFPGRNGNTQAENNTQRTDRMQGRGNMNGRNMAPNGNNM